jgi:hypothetical protein
MMMKKLSETDCAYLAAMLDIAGWRIAFAQRPNLRSHFENSFVMQACHTVVAQELLLLRYGKVCTFKRKDSAIFYLSKTEDGKRQKVDLIPKKRVVIHDTAMMLDLLKLIQPYLKIKKPYVHVFLEFLTLKIARTGKCILNKDKDRRMQLIEEFNHLRVIHEQGREDGL